MFGKIQCKYLLFLCAIFTLKLACAVKIQCKHADKIREDHIHYCCKHPDGHNDITEACAKKTGFKLPSSNEEAPEDNTVEQVVRGTCWAECVFDKYHFLKKKELDMDAVRKHYAEVHKLDEEYEREMVNAFEHCHGKSEEATVNFFNSFGGLLNTDHKSRMCDPSGTVILSCVIHEFFHNCPKDRWSNTQECKDTLAFAKKCRDALTTM